MTSKKFQTLLARIKGNDQTLTSIDLGHNKIGDEGAKALATALEKNQTITSIERKYS